VIRYFIILVETAIIVWIFSSEENFHLLLKKLYYSIPSPKELKNFIISGIHTGTIIAIAIILIAIGLRILFLITEKEKLMKNWEQEFIKAKAQEIQKIEELKTMAHQELQKAKNSHSTTIQKLREIEEKEAELERKRKEYIKKIQALEEKIKKLQAIASERKERLKKCQNKLKRYKERFGKIS
jgi:peptidoglycan hydrolase CwlO-like protein